MLHWSHDRTFYPPMKLKVFTLGLPCQHPEAPITLLSLLLLLMEETETLPKHSREGRMPYLQGNRQADPLAGPEPCVRLTSRSGETKKWLSLTEANSLLISGVYSFTTNSM